MQPQIIRQTETTQAREPKVLALTQLTEGHFAEVPSERASATTEGSGWAGGQRT
jgi:hypothetical protein